MIAYEYKIKEMLNPFRIEIKTFPISKSFLTSNPANIIL